MSGVELVLQPVIGRAAAELLQRLPVLRLSLVQLRTLEQHLFQALYLRAVWIVRGLAAGVVLAVNSHPLAGDDPCAHP